MRAAGRTANRRQLATNNAKIDCPLSSGSLQGVLMCGLNGIRYLSLKQLSLHRLSQISGTITAKGKPITSKATGITNKHLAK